MHKSTGKLNGSRLKFLSFQRKIKHREIHLIHDSSRISLGDIADSTGALKSCNLYCVKKAHEQINTCTIFAIVQVEPQRFQKSIIISVRILKYFLRNIL